MAETKKLDSKFICELVKDFMKDKDKQISIFITPEAATVEVTPYEKDEPRWIEDRERHMSSRFKCSACGHNFQFTSPYCPICGEKMKQPD